MPREGLDMLVLPCTESADDWLVALALRDSGVAEVSPGEVDIVAVVAAEGFSAAEAVHCRVGLRVMAC